MRYKSIANLSHDVHLFASRLRGFDLIVGIPRDGMLVASLLALYLDLPLADVDTLCQHRIYTAGLKYKHWYFKKVKRVLVIDDVLVTGRAIQTARLDIETASLQVKVVYAVMYPAIKSPAVDLYYEVIPQPRLCEWNLATSNVLPWSAVDMDGFLCVDPTRGQIADEDLYLKFMSSAKQLFKPYKSIGWIVTGRLEKYRVITEKWLEQHCIKYHKLIMHQSTERSQGQDFAQYKSDVYGKVKAQLFIESSYQQAKIIAANTNKDVLCWGTGSMIKI